MSSAAFGRPSRRALAFKLLEPLGLGQQLRQLEAQRADVVDLDRGSVLQQKVAVAALLAGNRIDDCQRRAAGQDLGSGQAAGLRQDQIGHGHQFIDLVGETDDDAAVPLGAGMSSSSRFSSALRPATTTISSGFSILNSSA